MYCKFCGCLLPDERLKIKSVYCSTAHRLAFHQRKHNGTLALKDETRCCVSCGTDFIPRAHKQIFCNKLCGDYYRQRTRYKGAYTNKYKSSSPYRFISQLLGYYGRRETLSTDYIHSLYVEQNGLCALSGVPMTHVVGEGQVNTNISIDRIDSSVGYIEGNIQLVCRIVNTMKLNMPVEELRWWCQQIINKD